MLFKRRKKLKADETAAEQKRLRKLQGFEAREELGWPKPEALESAMRKTFLGWEVWYKAIYMLNQDRSIATNQLARELKISFPSAKHLRERIERSVLE